MSVLINNKNICAKLCIICVSIIVLLLSIDLKFQITPFNTVCLLLYVFVILFSTIWITFVLLQRLLNQNKPFHPERNSLFGLLFHIVQRSDIPNDRLHRETTENVDVRIDKFIEDVERDYIRKWYSVYISKDDTFLRESRKVLDLVVRRFLQINEHINSEKIVHGILIILLKHVKEYRRSVRKVKSNGGLIETYYRYSHVGDESIETYSLQLTAKLLRHFVNWEIYSSLPGQCVTSVIAKKLIANSLIYTSTPGFINQKILVYIANKKDLQKATYVKIIDDIIEEDEVDFTRLKEPEIKQSEANAKYNSADTLIEKSEDPLTMDNVVSTGITTEVPIDASRIMSQPVKIHHSRCTNKTWRNSSDLDCISLGQDILSDIADSNMQDFEKNMWKNNSDSLETDESKLQLLSKESFLENLEATAVDHFKMISSGNTVSSFLRPSTTSAATILTNTIKPLEKATAYTMKEIQQSTMVHNMVKPMSQATSNAMHKIGDLQDEATGVVEGILDFGIAGLRKGLRLTGLQDNIQDANQQRPRSEKRDIPTKPGKQKLSKLGHVNSDDIKVEDSQRRQNSLEEHVWVNPLVKSNSSPSFEGDILLEKSPSAESRSLSSESTKALDIPGMEIFPPIDSPDPEYEDTTDLATTTAKLRSLLAQKTTESTLNTPAASPMSIITTPLDPSGGSIEELSDVDGALPNMYKAWAKTATGVFQNTLNSIKTALPGNVGDQEGHVLITGGRVGQQPFKQKWLFVQADTQPHDLSQQMKKFLAERQDFCSVDNAYEAFEAIELKEHLDNSVIIPQRQYDDELDDFDAIIPMAKALTDLICELIEDTYPPLVKEKVVKVLLLTTGNVIEERLREIGANLVKLLNGIIGPLPKFSTQILIETMKLEDIVKECLNVVPGVLKKIFSEEAIAAILKLLLESLQIEKINQDTNLQLMELIALEIINASSLTSPAFSA